MIKNISNLKVGWWWWGGGGGLGGRESSPYGPAFDWLGENSRNSSCHIYMKLHFKLQEFGEF